jgi:hypothetical protein
LKQSGIAMAQANNAEPPDWRPSRPRHDYTLQEAILKALEEKERKKRGARRSAPPKPSASCRKSNSFHSPDPALADAREANLDPSVDAARPLRR